MPRVSIIGYRKMQKKRRIENVYAQKLLIAIPRSYSQLIDHIYIYVYRIFKSVITKKESLKYKILEKN